MSKDRVRRQPSLPAAPRVADISHVLAAAALFVVKGLRPVEARGLRGWIHAGYDPEYLESMRRYDGQTIMLRDAAAELVTLKVVSTDRQ